MHPIDCVKTRIQSHDIGASVNTRKIVLDMLKNEGGRAFFNGLGTKLVSIVPKLTISFALAQTLTHKFSKLID